MKIKLIKLRIIKKEVKLNVLIKNIECIDVLKI